MINLCSYRAEIQISACSCVISSEFSSLPHYIEYANALFILLYRTILLLRLPDLLQNPRFLLYTAPAAIVNPSFNVNVVRRLLLFSKNYTGPQANTAGGCCMMNNHLHSTHFYASMPSYVLFPRQFPAFCTGPSPHIV